MKPMLIGSRALAYWKGKDWKNTGKDWDFICYDEIPEETPDGCRVEVHKASHLNNCAIYEYYECLCAKKDSILIAPPTALYILKRSHAWRALGFGKTIAHLHKEGLAHQAMFMGDYENKL